jgi:hypothetical protein
LKVHKLSIYRWTWDGICLFGISQWGAAGPSAESVMAILTRLDRLPKSEAKDRALLVCLCKFKLFKQFQSTQHAAP